MAELYKMGDSIKDAILTIMAYIENETGTKPTQVEVASLLSSYFIINEVGNQIKYQLKKGGGQPGGGQIEADEPFQKLNLKTGPSLDDLAKAGIFHRSIKAAIDSTRQYIKKTVGVNPSNDIIARSLKSSFILSEIVSQLDHHRKTTKK
ncbi:hypothetical protein D1AOALGA4SA_3981 [Olavius algarvensis Delta 1 endosymbiont]|nr:hypothetical protein D1AOALGA4SA_3981 [Olavius algarvensis Delta 1 endosymbiont]